MLLLTVKENWSLFLLNLAPPSLGKSVSLLEMTSFFSSLGQIQWDVTCKLVDLQVKMIVWSKLYLWSIWKIRYCLVQAYLLFVFNTFLNGYTRPLSIYFRPLLNTMTRRYSTKFDFKSIDGVLGIRTWDRRMVDADESTEFCGPLFCLSLTIYKGMEIIELALWTKIANTGCRLSFE